MANLIIKSSADNLVLQGSDASPAITVAAAGTTTFAENATLSGTANAIGTVATGNISNSAIVYPAGHVINTTEVFMSDYSVSNYDASTPTYFSPTTAVSMTSGNRMLITWQGTIMRNAGTITHHTYMCITGTGLAGNLNQAANNGRPAYLASVSHYRWPTTDTYSNGTAIILTDVINATSGDWGICFTAGTGATGTTFSIGNQIVIFQEIQQ